MVQYNYYDPLLQYVMLESTTFSLCLYDQGELRLKSISPVIIPSPAHQIRLNQI